MNFKKSFIFLVVLFFYILPLKWVGSHAGLGCLVEYGEIPCYLWKLFRGLFLWPFSDIWTDTGMQMVMLTYVMFGVGTILIFIVVKNIKDKD